MGWVSPSAAAVRASVGKLQVSITHPTPAATVTVVGTGDADLDPTTYPTYFVDVIGHFQEVFLRGASTVYLRRR